MMPLIILTLRARNLFPNFNNICIQLIKSLEFSFPAFPFMFQHTFTFTLTRNLIMDPFTSSSHIITTNMKFIYFNMVLAQQQVLCSYNFLTKKRPQMFKCPLPDFDARMFNFKPQEK